MPTQDYRYVLFVKIGERDRPAGPDDIKDMQDCFKAAFDQNDGRGPVIITHHAVKFEMVKVPVGTDGKPMILPVLEE
jgi:hypothetical protein